MAEVAKGQLELAIEQLGEVLPAASAPLAVSGLAPAEALGRNALLGLERLHELVSVPVNEAMMRNEPKMARLIGDMASVSLKLFMRAAEGEFQRRKGDAVEKLLQAIAEEKAGKNIC